MEVVLIAEDEVFGLVVVIGPLVVTLVDEVELEEGPVAEELQFPSWHTPYPQKVGPVPHFPAALQQSPHTPAHCL